MSSKSSYKIFCVFIYFFITELNAQDLAVIRGRVEDLYSKEPLVRVNVIVLETSYGDATDLNGQFEIKIPEGVYSLKFSMVGYEDVVIDSVIVNKKSEMKINIALKEKAVNLEYVVVTPKPEKYDASGISAKFDRTMITEAPGSAQDVFWVLQSLPGISSGSDDSKLYVRGGSANENLILFDGAIIKNPFHFEAMGGGLFSVFNSRLVQNVEFYSGGFPARFGDRLSSVLKIENKKGFRENLGGELNLSMSDVNGIIETPIPFLNSAGLISFRRSYFDLALKLVSDLSGDYSVIPYFFDVNAKFDFNFSAKNKLSLFWLRSNENLSANYDEPHFTGNMDLKSNSNLIGTNLVSILSEKTVSETDVYFSYSDKNSSYPGNSFEIIKDSELGFKQDISLLLDGHEIHFGGWLVNKKDNIDINLLPEVNFYTLEALKIKSSGNYLYSALYAEDKLNMSDKITVNLGMRADYIPKSNELNFSPRLNAAYSWNSHMSLSFDYGWYYQSPNPYELSSNPKIKSKKAESIGLGIRHQVGEEMIASIEAYNKKLTQLITINPNDWSFSNDGYGYARGIELYLQWKPENNLFGWLSYSYSVAKRKEGTHSAEHYFNFDRTHLLTLVANYSFSEFWQVGLKYRYGSGTPFTPAIGSYFNSDFDKYLPIVGEQNSARYPAYNRLDVRITRKIVFSYFTLSAYFEILNVFNNKNVIHYTYDEKYASKNPMTVFPLLPVLGINMKF